MQLSCTEFVETTVVQWIHLITRYTTTVGVVQVTTAIFDTPCSQTITTGPCYLLEEATEVYTNLNACTKDIPSTTQIETSLLTAVKDSNSEIFLPKMSQLTFLRG